VPPWEFPPSLTVDGLKARLDHTRDVNDDLLGDYLEAAFEQAQAPWPDGCGRLLRPDPALRFESADPPTEPPTGTYVDDEDPVTRTFQLGGRRRVVLPDMRTLADDGVVLDGTVVDAESLEAQGYELFMHKGHAVMLSVPTGSYGELEVTGRFGFATLPADLREAVYALAARYWHERAAMQADAVQVGEGAPTSAYYRQLPPRVRLTFSAYKLPAGLGGAA
jgi:hypothetical protein